MKTNAMNLEALEEQAMEQVAGGNGAPQKGHLEVEKKEYTVMECRVCGLKTMWVGNFVGGCFDCPNCKNHAFYGLCIREF